MSSINTVTFSGNITRDAEVRSTDSGTLITTFGLACPDRRKNQQTGEWEDHPNFFDLVMFGARGQKLSEAGMLAKGAKVVVSGKARWSRWESEGQARSKVEFVVDEIEFLSARRDQAAPAQQQPAAMPAADAGYYPEDVPF